MFRSIHTHDQKKYIRLLEEENQALKALNKQLQHREQQTDVEWSYIDCVRKQYRNKLTSQFAREKQLNEGKREVRIREAQLEFNEARFSQCIAEEVKTRAEARIANRPEPPPPASGYLFCGDCIYRSTVDIPECPKCETLVD